MLHTRTRGTTRWALMMATLTLLTGTAWAHHGWTGYEEKEQTVTGTIRESSYENPHGSVPVAGRRHQREDVARRPRADGTDDRSRTDTRCTEGRDHGNRGRLRPSNHSRRNAGRADHDRGKDNGAPLTGRRRPPTTAAAIPHHHATSRSRK